MNDAAEPQSEGAHGAESMFDTLARFVPDDLQKEYYRVVAHTHTLGPDDEMLRILEAMGILALVTRHTPAEIAEEREHFRQMLHAYMQLTTETQEKIIQLGLAIDSRLVNLPKAIEAGLNPQQLSTLLGETLRQNFVSAGIHETASALNQTGSAMRAAQKDLALALRELSDARSGIAARIDSANSRIDHSVELRAKRIDALLRELRTDLLRIWFPIVAGGALVIGFSAGRTLQEWRDSSLVAHQSVSTVMQKDSIQPRAPKYSNPAPVTSSARSNSK